MSFLNTFIELSILSEELNQSNELNYHTSLLQEQNENINSLIQHQQQQDWIRDYMYRINKACELLEKSKDKDSLDFYYSIYCLAKGINESGLSTSAISELKDKEYFDNCLDRIGILMFNFAQNHKHNISEFNNHIQNFEELYIFAGLKESEDARYRINQINKTIEPYEKERKRKPGRSFLGFLPLGIIASLGFYGKIKYNFIPFKNMNEDSYLGICGILVAIAFIVGDIIGEKWTKKAISKQKNSLTKEAYNDFLKERADNIQKLSKDNVLYEYANDTFPDLDFSEENYSHNSEKIHSAISKKETDLLVSLNLLKHSVKDIHNRFCIYE